MTATDCPSCGQPVITTASSDPVVPHLLDATPHRLGIFTADAGGRRLTTREVLAGRVGHRAHTCPPAQGALFAAEGDA